MRVKDFVNGATYRNDRSNKMYMLVDGLLYRKQGVGNWERSDESYNTIITSKYTEVYQ